MLACNLGKLISKQQITPMNKNQELIWRYLSGEMSTQEQKEFEQELSHNSQLQESFEQEKELKRFILNKGPKTSALKNLTDVHNEFVGSTSGATGSIQEMNTKQPNSSNRNVVIRWLIPAAIAATMAIGYLFMPTEQATPQDIYAAHFEPSEISFSTRGENSTVILSKVAELYNAGSWDSTIGLIEKLPDDVQSNDKVIYTKGISLIASQRHDEGRALLEKLPALYGDEVSWYKALSFLQENKKIEAIAALSAISPKFNRYEDVNTILEQLQ